MKAVVKAKAEPGLWLDEVPVPEVRGDDVLIRVLKASICGTDVHIYNWDAWAQKTIPVPMSIERTKILFISGVEWLFVNLGEENGRRRASQMKPWLSA